MENKNANLFFMNIWTVDDAFSNFLPKLSKGRDQCVYNHLSVEYLYILRDVYPTSFPGSSPTQPPWERGWFISAVYLPAYNS